MIHDLYLRAHIVVAGDKDEQKKEKEKSSKRPRALKLWPDYALVFDTETTLDLEQALNFGVWRFCQLQGREYVSVQEGIFYRDGLPREDVDAILGYQKKRQDAALKTWNPADQPDWLDEKFYRERVKPHLPAVQVPMIQRTLSISEPYALRIRAGKCVPHPRHWLGLAKLVTCKELNSGLPKR